MIRCQSLSKRSRKKSAALCLALSCALTLNLLSPTWADLPRVADQKSIQAFTTQNPQWRFEAGKLKTQYTFRGGFKMAVQFVQLLVEPADQLRHHPDLTVSYNRVQVSLTTHDVGGITEADLKLAQIIQRIYQKLAVTE